MCRLTRHSKLMTNLKLKFDGATCKHQKDDKCCSYRLQIYQSCWCIKNSINVNRCHKSFLCHLLFGDHWATDKINFDFLLRLNKQFVLHSRLNVPRSIDRKFHLLWSHSAIMFAFQSDRRFHSMMRLDSDISMANFTLRDKGKCDSGSLALGIFAGYH